MKSDSDNVRTFTRRAVVIGAFQGCLLAALGGRLAWLQVAQGARYKTLSDKNRINMKLVPPSRGQIVDRFGVPMAVNERNFRVLVIPEQTDDLERSLRELGRFISLHEEEIRDILEQSTKSAKFVPLEVRDDLSWEDVARIEVNLPDLPGLSINAGEKRSYPFGEATAHIIGYVGAVSKADLNGDPVLSLPGFRIGKTGIEKKFDSEMRGTAGTSEVEVNVIGREVRELGHSPGREGARVTLTIDGELQRFAQKRLEEERSASAVIMDVHTGAVYALASAPAFDPNAFTGGISAALWEELLADEGHPLTNKAIAGQYPPASTFKMVTALAALEAGIIDRHKTVFCPGHFKLGGDKFHCWKKWGHGRVDLTEALAQSCDTYFYAIAGDLGIDRIAAMARRLGLGERLDFDLGEERPGLVPDKNWKMGYFGESWRPGESVVASIGQGYTLATPLQLATMTARLVNGGHAVRPWMTAFVGRRPESAFLKRKRWPRISLPAEHLALIKQGMDAAVNGERGTAKASQIIEAGYSMGGKTGTAQVKRITMEQRLTGVKNEDMPWKYRHHGLFVGYSPLDKPVYACAVVVEHGVGGSVSAAPLARDLLLEAQKRSPADSPLQPESS